MPFDAKAFAKAKFEPRTAELRIPELQEWFGDDDPVFVVRGLSGIELAPGTTLSEAEPRIHRQFAAARSYSPAHRRQ